MNKKSVTLMIDGRSVTVPEGTLIVDAAKTIGIDIPVFCYHPKMEPVGMCRMCLVEVGRPCIDRESGQLEMEDGRLKIQYGAKLETACTTPVCEGMVVNGMSEKAVSGRKEIVEFLLTSHPLDCPICDKGGECPLQNLTMEHGSSESRFHFDDKQRQKKHVPLGDLIWLDRERCIQCARCIRFQRDIAGDAVLGFYNRGRATDIVTCSEPGFDSVFSGNTTDICPVGALTTSDFRFGARPWEMESTSSICTQCAVGCNTILNTRREVKSGGKIVIKRVLPRHNEYINEIWLCDKGRFAHHYTSSISRLEKPLVRNKKELEETNWDVAISKAGDAIKGAGKDLLVLAGGKLANEDLFNLKSLSDKLGAKAGLYTDMGGGSFTTRMGVCSDHQLGELGAGSCILVASSDLYQEAPLWYLRIKQAAERGATLIVAAGRETKLEKYASHVIRYAYGDESQVIRSLESTKAGKNSLEAIKAADNLVILFGSDGLGLDGTNSLAYECADLLKRSGQGEKAGSGLIGVWPHVNDQGAWELGFEPIEDLASEFKDKVVYIVACDPAGDDPILGTALSSARKVIVQDLFLTETGRLADVVLPAQAFSEREGTFTSGERRVQRFHAAVPPSGESKVDFAITAKLAEEVDIELEGISASSIFEKLVDANETFKGMTYASLEAPANQAAWIDQDDIYYGGIGYRNESGLGAVLAVADKGKLPNLNEYEFIRPNEDELLALPVVKLYDQGATVKPSEILSSHNSDTSVRMNKDTAARYKLQDGSKGKVTIKGNSFQVKIVLDERVPTSTALISRSMGIPINNPAYIQLKAA